MPETVHSAHTQSRDMRQQGLQPDVVTYGALITALAKADQPAQALVGLRAMRQQGLQPDVVTYSALINAFAEANQPSRALEVLKEMRQQGRQPDSLTYNSLISGCDEAMLRHCLPARRDYLQRVDQRMR